jgi:predicted transglutaminase-like protease
VSSEEFVKTIRAAVSSAPKANVVDKKLSPAEVDEWLKIFREKGK